MNINKLSLVSFLIFPSFIVFFILIQSIYVWMVYDDNISALIIIICFSALTTYALGFFIGGYYLPRFPLAISKKNMDRSRDIVYLFILIHVFLFFNHGSVPFFDYLLNGENPMLARRSFNDSFDDGLAEVVYYLKSIVMRGVLPFIIVYLAMNDTKKRFYSYLIGLSFLSILTFEKANIFWVFLPLFLLFFINKNYKDLVRISAVFVIFFTIVSISQLSVFVSSVEQLEGRRLPHRASDLVMLSKAESKLESKSEIDVFKRYNYSGFLAEVPGYRFYLQESANEFDYLLNRAFWIPFVTTYDTILYWQQKLYSKHLGFSVNRHLSRIVGAEFADLEREVFRFQFGSGLDSTGNANAFYGAEAYVGFGILGVVLFSFAIGVIFSMFVFSYSFEGNLLLFATSFGLINASFISMLFSGGIAFSIIVLLFYSRRFGGHR